MPNPVKSLGYRVTAVLLKALAVLPNLAVSRSAVEREDRQSYWKLEERPLFDHSLPVNIDSRVDQFSLNISYSLTYSLLQ